MSSPIFGRLVLLVALGASFPGSPAEADSFAGPISVIDLHRGKVRGHATGSQFFFTSSDQDNKNEDGDDGVRKVSLFANLTLVTSTPSPPSPPPRQKQDAVVALVKTCPTGHETYRDKVDGQLHCRCKKFHLHWPEDGFCYREYDRGPCPEGHRYSFVPSSSSQSSSRW